MIPPKPFEEKEQELKKLKDQVEKLNSDAKTHQREGDLSTSLEGKTKEIDDHVAKHTELTGSLTNYPRSTRPNMLSWKVEKDFADANTKLSNLAKSWNQSKLNTQSTEIVETKKKEIEKLGNEITQLKSQQSGADKEKSETIAKLEDKVKC
ncbi:hypothetical protein Cantr_05879 [Candida viswanathii]|uniref:Uncharacterized protein n=1 Tax=Candida viswanathii TaxID=5486 RepID=A0A367XSW4_9ASCO|nr:hypothetical protein Cantr_05879 [Candida viswanathii]